MLSKHIELGDARRRKTHDISFFWSCWFSRSTCKNRKVAAKKPRVVGPAFRLVVETGLIIINNVLPLLVRGCPGGGNLAGDAYY